MTARPWWDPLVQVQAAGQQRPVLVLSRDEVTDQLNQIIVAPITSTIRGIPTEVPPAAVDG